MRPGPLRPILISSGNETKGAETMAVAGQTISNPQTGERITFRRTAADTKGEFLELAFFVAPGGAPAAKHVHPRQVEHFDVHSGSLRITIGDNELAIGPGQRATVPAGTPHIWRAARDEELQMTLTFEPALTAERFFEQFFALANAGRTKPDGTMRLLDAAVVLDENRDFLYLPKPRVGVQKAVFRLLAQLGRLFRRGRVPHGASIAAQA
jgi:mannose-6-phosphate isomerase-like protein (cupin superfamily)